MTRHPGQDDSLIIHAGRYPERHDGVVNPPVYHASTILFDSIREFAERYHQRLAYGRMGTATQFALEDALSALEGAHGTLLAPSGLAAISTTMLAFCEAGSHLLVTDSAYHPTRHFCDHVLARYGVEVEYYDPRIGAGIADLLRPQTRLVWMENPGSMTFEIQDIPAISAAARAHGAISAVDNSWGAGYFLKPLALGADISVQAATKYIVGHSDAMLGSIACNEAAFSRVHDCWWALGVHAAPDDAYLGQRGLRTLGVRLRHQHDAGLKIARWLEGREEIAHVLHPGLESHPDHGLWQRDFSGASGLFSVVFHETREAPVAAMADHMTYFGIGASWGGYESLVLPGWPEKSRSAVAWTEPGRLLRFHIGLEHPDDLIADLDAGLDRLRQAAAHAP